MPGTHGHTSDAGTELVGDTLILREFDDADLDGVQSYACDPVVTRFLEWGPNSIEDTRSFLRRAAEQAGRTPRTVFDLAIVDIASKTLVGGAVLSVTSAEHRRAEIGYIVHPEFWGRGIATEAARLLLRFGFDHLGLRRISATCDPDNHGSAKVLQKAGLLFEGRMRSHRLKRGTWRDSLLYAATSDDRAARADVLRSLAGLLIERQSAHPLRVAIDGITASGKTTLADELAEAIAERGHPVVRIRMDDFHHRREHRYRQGKDSARGYYDDAYDFEALNERVLQPLSPGGDRLFSRRVIDLASDTVIDEPPERAAPESILIADGSFMQRHHRSSWDVVVVVNTSFDEALRRGINRDAAQFGGHAAAEQRYAQRYHAASHMYIDEINPLQSADFVIDNDDPTHPRLHRTSVR
ncbi:GNAT family N-acetyltransferase (plasmid) [Mycobacterium avium subsp. hominissuis]|uniref:GNAT family N-acetyltransferase n=1 Tax=Mycobacterium avium TaxID=1764 RepID=UPI0031404861